MLIASVLALVLASQAREADAASACARLTSLALPNATVTIVETVAAGAFVPPTVTGMPSLGVRFAQLPSFCRVAATLTPSADSDIKIEVWMPTTGWNGKFLAVGNGGWSGAIVYPALASVDEAANFSCR